MDGHVKLAPRPSESTDPHPIREVEHHLDALPAARSNLARRFADWVEPTAGTVGTGGGLARALLCALLCVIGALAIVGAVTGLVMAIAWIV